MEWDRNRKAVATVTRPQYDIVAGTKLRNGNYAVYTQQGQIISYDKTGKQLESLAPDGKLQFDHAGAAKWQAGHYAVPRRRRG